MDGGVTAGLNYARGDAAMIMTANLQDPPEMIPRFIKKWEEGTSTSTALSASAPGRGGCGG